MQIAKFLRHFTIANLVISRCEIIGDGARRGRYNVS